MFTAYLHVYQQKETTRIQISWEQIRWQTALILQPYSKKTLQPSDIAVFPWEKAIEQTIEVVDSIPPHFQKLAAAMDAHHKANNQ